MVTLFGGHNYGECINRTLQETPLGYQDGITRMKPDYRREFYHPKIKGTAFRYGEPFFNDCMP